MFLKGQDYESIFPLQLLNQPFISVCLQVKKDSLKSSAICSYRRYYRKQLVHEDKR